MQSRLYMPIDVDHTREYNPGGNPHQRTRLTLQPAREQERERHRELEQHQKQRYIFPSAMQAKEEPRNFIRQVARPDDEQLREIEVRPDHNESQHELAMVVDFGIGKVFGHRLAFAEDPLDYYAETEGGKRLARNEDEAVDGRDPARLQRHHPIDHGKGDGERVDDESKSTHDAEAQRALTRYRVLFGRPAIQEVGHPVPQDEVEDGPRQDAVEV